MGDKARLPPSKRTSRLGEVSHSARRILNPRLVGNRFLASFVYGFHSKADRCPLWANLVHTRTIYSDPWLLLGDFNSVLKSDERRNGSVVSPYEIKDFEECCFELGISDLQFTGLFYTWTNMTVWSKLDRAMVDHNWILAGFNSRVEFLPSGSSDHSPCVVSLFDTHSSGKTPWRFFNMLAEHHDFHQVVQDGWQSHYRGTAQFILCQQLKGLKDNLKALNEKHFSHISSRAKHAKEKLKETQKLFHDFPHDLEIRSQLLELRKSSLFLSKAEKLFYQQKAKCNYLIQSDKCTRFFHSIVKRNAKKNFIASIVREDGNPTVSQDQVALEFIEFYKQLLGTKQNTQPPDPEIIGNGPLLDETQGTDLIKPITNSEILDALRDIGDDRSPGSDGYSSAFFKKSWTIVGEQVCDAVKEFFSSGCLLKQWNHTILALIPKSDHSSKVGDFRPIACCKVIYKLISKILATRMADVLDPIIDGAQAAFVKGRNMVEHIHLMQELLDNIIVAGALDALLRLTA
ncbi:hypothetical protein DH2020_041087 [Rehmannia glutinosa]|uniref:Reverse transcriptase domain-containing protein n=1 Tax=Rehmannia glutinosa TaxID=99300 RepID=A0ABR0URU4_REHGL